MNSLLIGAALLLTLVLAARARALSAGRRRGGGLLARFNDPVAPASGGRPTMPRLGRPGTITAAQRAACDATRLTPNPGWSREEADLILDAVAFLRAACRAGLNEPAPAIAVQNELLMSILLDADLRDAVAAWGRTRRAEGGEAALPNLPAGAAYDRIVAKATALLRPEARRAAEG